VAPIPRAVAFAAIVMAYAAATVVAAVPARRPVVPGDTYALRFVASLEVAPDGRSLAYVVQKASRRKDGYENTLHLMPAEGGKTRVLTSSDADETSPRFSRDGRRLVDYLSSFGQDQWFTQYLEELGSPIADEDKYRRLSPGTYVPNIKTPLYLIANEKDGNCPLPQAMQLYQRLRQMGKKTELVIYPGESHSMQRPTHLVDRLERLRRWFGAHLSADATPPAARP